MSKAAVYRLLALVLLIGLMLSFFWCTATTIVSQAERSLAGEIVAASSGEVAGALMWLWQHALHGGAALLLPALLFRKTSKPAGRGLVVSPLDSPLV